MYSEDLHRKRVVDASSSRCVWYLEEARKELQTSTWDEKQTLMQLPICVLSVCLPVCTTLTRFLIIIDETY